MLSPIAPHFCHHVWKAFGNKKAIIDESWPQVDKQALLKTSLEMVIQINGKVRAKIEVAADASDDDVLSQALENPNVIKFIEGKEIKMKKVIPGKLVTIAVK
jgi:leucyl-tRNA synthetase